VFSATFVVNPLFSFKTLVPLRLSGNNHSVSGAGLGHELVE